MIWPRLLFVLGMTAFFGGLGIFVGPALFMPPEGSPGIGPIGFLILGALGGAGMGLAGSLLSLIWLKSPVWLRWLGVAGLLGAVLLYAALRWTTA